MDLHDDEADALEAYFETWEDQIGTIGMGTVNFYELELRDATTWHDWTTTYSTDTYELEEGGYSVTVNTNYDDFDVDN
jgi:hypothetical protein